MTRQTSAVYLSQFTQVSRRLLAEDSPGADHAEPDRDRKASDGGGERARPAKDEIERHDPGDDQLGGERPGADAKRSGRSAEEPIFDQEH